MKKRAQLNAFKADPMNRFAKDKPVLFFAITVSIFHTVFFITVDVFNVVADATLSPNSIRLKITGYILLWSMALTIGIRHRWKRIEK